MKEQTTENPKLLMKFVRLKPRSRVKSFIQRKADGIFRRYPRLEAIRINVKRESESSANPSYIAQTRLVLPGYDRIIEKRGAALFEAIAEAFEVADRQLRKRARLFKARQRHEPI